MFDSFKSKLRVFAVGIVLTFPGVASADTASCLSECTKAFAECRKGAVSTNDFANCLQQRKECIESCGNTPD